MMQDDEETKIQEGTRQVTSQTNLLFVEEAIPKFSGTDATYTVVRWSQEIEDNAEIFGLTPLQKLLIARRTLTSTAAAWLRSEKVFKSYEELKAALFREFPDSINSKKIHEMLSMRKKNKNESCYEYMLEMKAIAKRAKMADYVTIEYIIEGILDEERNKIMLYGVTTFSDLKLKLKLYEEYKMKQSATRGNIPSKPSVQYNVKRCYSCGEQNHRSSECPSKRQGPKCFKCNEFGHIGPKCMKYENGGGAGGTPYMQQQRHREESSSRPAFGQSRHYPTQTQTIRDERQGQQHSITVGPTTTKRTMFGESGESNLTSDSDNFDGTGMTSLLSVKNVNNNKDGKPLITIFLDTFSTKALLDTGSDTNLVEEKCYNEVKHYGKSDDLLTLTGLGLCKVQSLGKCNLPVEIDGKSSNVTFYIVPNGTMPYSVILGQEFLKDYTVVFETGVIHLVDKGDDWFRKLDIGACSNFVLGENCSSSVQQEVMQCINNYEPLQAKESPIKLKIILKDDIPVTHRHRRLSLKEQISKIQEEKRYFDKKRKEIIKYKEGDRVAFKRTQFKPGLKLKEKYFGPYLVTKAKRGDRYDVTKIDSSKEGSIKTSSSADFMKPWFEFDE